MNRVFRQGPRVPTRARVARQQGSFIIEAMMSLAIFSIALIGVLGLVASALNQLSQSKSRNDASYAAGDLISEMWVSPSVNIDTWATRLATIVPGATGDVYFATCDCLAGSCTSGDLRTGAQTLASPQPVTICIKWVDKKEQDAGTTVSDALKRRYQTSTVISRN